MKKEILKPCMQTFLVLKENQAHSQSVRCICRMPEWEIKNCAGKFIKIYKVRLEISPPSQRQLFREKERHL